MLICSQNSAYCQPPLNLTSTEVEAAGELLRACDKALATCEAAGRDKDAIIKTQSELLETQNKQISKLAARPLTDNPLIWFIGGMLVTGLTVRLVK